VAVVDQVSLQALAREVAALLGHDAAAPVNGLLTARQVAARFNVDRGWVYAHAHELGVVRLGNGPRPRLRFDSAVVAQRLVSTATDTAPPRPAPTAGAPLLPITPSRRRRRLEV
jgi:hypothetical protein